MCVCVWGGGGGGGHYITELFFFFFFLGGGGHLYTFQGFLSMYVIEIFWGVAKFKLYFWVCLIFGG